MPCGRSIATRTETPGHQRIHHSNCRNVRSILFIGTLRLAVLMLLPRITRHSDVFLKSARVALRHEPGVRRNHVGQSQVGTTLFLREQRMPPLFSHAKRTSSPDSPWPSPAMAIVLPVVVERIQSTAERYR